MKNIPTKKKIKLYPIVWTGIILVSIYIIYRYASLSFSVNVGQAEGTIKNVVVSKICSKVMEEGSALMNYTSKGYHGTSGPFDLMSKHISIQKFSLDDSSLTANAKDKTSFPDSKADSNAKSNDATPVMSTNVASDEKGYYKINGGVTKEYLLTNGLVYNDSLSSKSNSTELLIGYTPGEVDDAESENDDTAETVNTSAASKYTLAQLKNFNFLVSNFYVVDSSTRVTKDIFDGEKLISKDLKIKQKNDKPQILIYHTHAHEAFSDSRPNNFDDSVVGVGDELTDILENKYHYNVIHDRTGYDIVNGVLDRSKAYDQALAGINNVMKEYPSIEVVIDLHRDGGAARYVTINGKKCAQAMMFNGLSRDKDGPIKRLYNPNLQNNLAFSLQMQLKARDLFPGFFVKNYLKDWRYNMHVRPKSLLVELGTDKNTLQSAKNSMEPFAKVLDTILQGK